MPSGNRAIDAGGLSTALFPLKYSLIAAQPIQALLCAVRYRNHVKPATEQLPLMPRFTVAQAQEKLETSFPTANAAVPLLEELGSRK